MHIYDSSLWYEDIDTVSEILLELDKLAGKSVLITGAAGLICSAVVDVFIRYNETHKRHIGILAAGRKKEGLKERFGDYFNKEYFHYIPYDAIKTDLKIEMQSDYVIHGAGNSSPKMIIAEPVETMLSNFGGLYELLVYARGCQAKRVLYVSSSEIYGIKTGSEPYKEKDYGYIDLHNSRNAYSIGKRAAETLCVSFTEEYGVDTVIVRPGHIYGPTALRQDNHISNVFARAAARGEKLVMKTAGAQIRSYCHCLDCASAIIKVLIKGEAGQAYNISNPNSICTIRQMAEEMAKAGHVELAFETASQAEKRIFNPMSNSSLDSEKLLSLGWKGCFDIECGCSRTIKILQDIYT